MTRYKFWRFHGDEDSSYDFLRYVPSSGWKWRQQDLQKYYYITTALHSVRTQKTTTWNSLRFMEPEKLEPCSQDPATAPYPKWAE
jgi:hypothetical protein